MFGLQSRPVVLVILGGLLAAGVALAEPVAWNQERAAALANKLATEVARIKFEVPDAKGDPNIKEVVHQDLGTLQHRTVALASHLSGGQNREQTKLLFNHIQALVVALQKDADALPDIRDEARGEIKAARGALDELTKFYE